MKRRRKKGRKQGSGINAKFAKALKVTEQRVSQLRRQGMPITSVKAAQTWVAANVQRRTGAVASEMQRLRAAQAARAEMDMAERRGELGSIAEFQIVLNELMVAFRGEMLGRSARNASQLAGMADAGQIRQLLLDEDKRILAACAARVEDWARRVIRGEPVVPAPGSDARPVG